MFEVNEEIIIGDILLKFIEKAYYLPDSGFVYAFKVACNCDRDRLSTLVGKEIKGKKVLGVESFAVLDQSHRPVGLLLEE